MDTFTKIYKKIMEDANTSSSAFVKDPAAIGYAPGDNRPIDPAKAVLGVKWKKGKKLKIPMRRRKLS